VDGLRERDNQELRMANAEKRETADPYRQKQCKHRKKKKKKVYSNKKQ
jgi:hypothetical protein